MTSRRHVVFLFLWKVVGAEEEEEEEEDDGE